MKKIIIALLFFLLLLQPSYAITLLEKIAYKKDTIKAYNAKVLVNPLTGEIKYIWYETIPAGTNGYWAPVSGTAKEQFQAMYDLQRKRSPVDKG